MYVDTTLPQLKNLAMQIEDNHFGYYEEIKNRFVKTSGWLWKQADTSAVLDEVYKMMLCILRIREFSRKTGYMSFEQIYEYLRKKVRTENKVSLELLLDHYPSLKTFLELVVDSTISTSKIGLLGDLLAQQNKVIESVFFDDTREVQLAIMKDVFGKKWPDNITEAHSLYDSFHENASMYDRQRFQELGQKIIDDFMQKSVSLKLLSLWQQRTNSDSPTEWSQLNKLPVECFLNVEDIRSVTDIILNPHSVATERLHEVYTTLEDSNAFLDISTAGSNFLSRVLPRRYLSIGFTVEDVSLWLSNELDSDPNRWLANIKINETVEKRIKQKYDTLIRSKAEDKLCNMSDAESKKLLFELIRKIPDVGLAIME